MSNNPVAVEVWAQDPLSMPERVTIAIPNVHMDSGPRDSTWATLATSQNV